MPKRRIAAILALAAAIAAGCGGGESGMRAPGLECEAPCVLPAILVTVVDARTGAIVPDASVSVSGPTCTPDTCSCQPGTPPERQFVCLVLLGAYTVTAQASGYVAGTAVATVASSGGSGCCQQATTRVTIPLSP